MRDGPAGKVSCLSDQDWLCVAGSLALCPRLRRVRCSVLATRLWVAAFLPTDSEEDWIPYALFSSPYSSRTHLAKRPLSPLRPPARGGGWSPAAGTVWSQQGATVSNRNSARVPAPLCSCAWSEWWVRGNQHQRTRGLTASAVMRGRPKCAKGYMRGVDGNPLEQRARASACLMGERKKYIPPAEIKSRKSLPDSTSPELSG